MSGPITRLSFRPSRPDGRKIRTSTSTVKAITSWSWLGDGIPYPVSSRFGPTCSRTPSEEAAEHRADDVADAAQHRRREGLDAGQEAHEEVDLVEEQRVEDAGRSGEQAADGEGRDDDAIDVDAHHRRHVLVLAHRAHRATGAGAVDEEVEARASVPSAATMTTSCGRRSGSARFRPCPRRDRSSG